MRNPAYLLAVGAAVCACHGSSSGTSPDASDSADASSADASNLQPVSFSYTPEWGGVQTVEVIGGFGQPGDWTTPLVTLTTTGMAGSAGDVFTGTAMLPPGTYAYLFHVVGDSAAGSGAVGSDYSRYSLDGDVSAFAQCPAASPSAKDSPLNPCSQLTVPQGLADETYTINGTAMIDGSAAPKYLVVLERMEAGSHHYFVNRRQTSGTGTWSLNVAPGMYRVQIQNPQFESKKDSQLPPGTNDIIRRTISAAFAVKTANLAVGSADVTPPDYTAFEPRGSAVFPTTFEWAAGVDARLDVYGSGAEIGDPWFTSPPTAGGSAVFDGDFNTTAGSAAGKVTAGDTYNWGIEFASGSAAVTWTVQSLVYQVMWATGPKQ